MPTYLSPGVYVEEVEPSSRPIEGVGTAVAAFVGFAETGPFHVPRRVTNWSEFTKTYGDFVPDTYLAHAVYGFFQNGGGSCWVVRLGRDAGQGSSKNGSAKSGSAKEQAATSQAVLGSYRFSATGGGDGTDQKDITIEISTPATDATGGDTPTDGAQGGSFTIVVKRGTKTEETYESLTTARGEQNIVDMINKQSALITVEETGGAPVAAPEPGTVTLQPTAPATPAPARLDPQEIAGDVSERRGLGGLAAVEEITMVCVPDLMSAFRAGAIDAQGVRTVQNEMVTHCEQMGDRVAILDPPPDLSPQAVKTWRADEARFDSKYATLYYPWVQVYDQAKKDQILVPPSGHVAGIWARNDDTRGVHKAPGNEIIRGVNDLPFQVTNREQESLNPIGVNCLRSFRGRGVRVWGARTLSSDPAWRYLNVRRLFNYLEESILAGTQWVVFEPNDEALWARLRRTIGDFLTTEWRKGALFGLTPNEAFYVKCDRETNPPEIRDLGQVVCDIGVAPVKPAEFVIFRLAQYSGGTSTVNE